jgi:hypothetical protein
MVKFGVQGDEQKIVSCGSFSKRPKANRKLRYNNHKKRLGNSTDTAYRTVQTAIYYYFVGDTILLEVV